MKETIAIIGADALFAKRPDMSEVSDIISYLMTRDSYARPEDADGDPVKRYAIVCKITIEEID